MADNDWWFDLKTKTPVQDSKAGKGHRSARPISDSRGGRAGAGEGRGTQRGVRPRSALERRLTPCHGSVCGHLDDGSGLDVVDEAADLLPVRNEGRRPHAAE